jgi:hypothetical protein
LRAIKHYFFGVSDLLKFIVVDPGKIGAAVKFKNFGTSVEAIESLEFEFTDNAIHTKSILKFFDSVDIVFIEQPGTYSGNAKTIATQFRIFGALEAIAHLSSCESVKLFQPREWVKFLARYYSSDSPPKTLAQKSSREFFPHFADLSTPKKGKKVHEGIADCLAIALYLFCANKLGVN